MGVGAHERTGAGDRHRVAGDDGAAWGEDLQLPAAEAVAHLDLGAHKARGERVAVALVGHERRCPDPAGDAHRRRVRRSREGDEALGAGDLPDARPIAPTPVAGGGEEPVELGLRVGHVADGRRAPPALGDEVVGRLDGALAVGPAGRADIDGHAVVAGDRGEARVKAPRPRITHARHPVGAPAPRRAAEATQHRVDRLHQVGLILGFGEHRPALARVGQRPDQQVRLGRPGRAGELQPIPLDLLARLVGDLDRRPPPHPRTGLTVRPQCAAAELAGEDLVAPVVTERSELVVERRGPQMGVFPEALAGVRLERGEVVGHGGPAPPRPALTGQIGPDRLSVAAQVTGDGRDRPPPPPQCGCLHVFLLCEHQAGLPRRGRLASPAFEGAPPDPVG